MQDEQGLLELHGADRAIGAPSIVFDNFQHTRTTEPFSNFAALCRSPRWAKSNA